MLAQTKRCAVLAVAFQRNNAGMATLQEQLVELNLAITAGVRQVTIGGETTVFNTIDSLIKARNDLKERIAAETAAAAGQPVRRVRRLYFAGRGYD